MMALVGLGLICVPLIGYRISLWLWPYTPCRSCGGDGQNPGSNRRRWGLCPTCGGSGKQERLGVRLFARRR
ncbi:hypothetical protein [Actinoallomurus sp. NPDC052274]|uniref:hypothetical protein n=1 Tax=Actinoallomurus sp. NPDC052274 TaxID=3155420 RepID=UPI0034171905